MASERILGLDITKKRIGWALVDYNPNDSAENLLVDCGGFDFNAGEIPKTGESPNKPRRDARIARRTIKKRRRRKAALLKLFTEKGLVDTRDTDRLFRNRFIVSPWDLRAKALDAVLSGEELSRVLYHIGGKRGYQFTRAEEMDMNDGESGKMKEGGRALVSAMEEAGSRTIGEYLSTLERKRNRPQLNEKKGVLESVYDRSIHRSLLRREVEAIFAAQQALGSSIASDELKAAFEAIAFFVPDPQSTERLLGKCTFFPDETRAVKASFDAEEFVALTRFINCVVEMPGTGNEKKLTSFIGLDELMKVAKEKPSISHADIRKLLGLGDEWIFKGIKYDTKTKKASKKAAKAKAGLSDESADEPQEKIVLDYKYEKKPLVEMRAYHLLKNALGSYFGEVEKVYNRVAFILTVERGENRMRDRLWKLGLGDEIVEILINAADPKVFKETINISHKALDVILPQMREGKRYDQATLELGMPTFSKDRFLPALEKTHIEVNNPIVLRVASKLRTLVNEIIRYHGQFHKVHIELGRDMSTKAEQRMIDSAQREREAQKKIAAAKIKELFGDSIQPTRKNVEKMMLWSQQNEICLYTGERISIERLYEDGYAAIDYILPRSRSFDESFGNMVLTFAKEKHDKADKTPYEWFGDNGDKWESFKSLLSSPAFYAKLGRGKVNRLLKENFNDQSAGDVASKRLENSRAYAAKVIKELVEEYLDMPKSPLGGKIQVYTRNAWLTAELRRQWIGYEAQHEYNDRMGVLNAVLVAFSTQGMIQSLSQHFKWKETQWEKEKKSFDLPYPSFRKDVAELLKHDRTEADKNGVIRRRLLIVKTPRKKTTGPAHDAGVSSASANPNAKGVLVRQGTAIAAHKSMVRLDVFRNGNKNAFVPVYVADMRKPLSNQALVGAKGIKDLVKDSQFAFTLWPDDLVGIVQKGKEVVGYYSSFNISTNAISVNGGAGIGAGTTTITKYTVSPIGFYCPIKSEPRLPTKSKKA